MLKLKLFLNAILWLFFSNGLFGQNYLMDSNTSKAYKEILQLRLVDANQSLVVAKQTTPSNLMTIYIEDYVDFLKLIIDENENDFKRLLPIRENRLKLLESGNSKSPYHLYTQAQVHIHWALIKVKFGHYVNAFNEIRKAYTLLTKNQLKFPDFNGNKVAIGMLNTLLGTVPEEYQWGVKLMGMKGSVNKGLTEIRAALQVTETPENFFFKHEGVVMYAFLLLHFGNEETEAWSLLRKTLTEPEKSPLYSFLLANMQIHLNKNDEAIKLLTSRPQGEAYHPFHYADYMLGIAKLNRLDDDADIYLKKYIIKHTGRHFIKDAYLKLAWFALLHHRQQDYLQAMNMIKTKGAAMMESDKAALKMASETKFPDLTLLKARLLYDGGYDKKALVLLNTKTYHDFKHEKDLLEFAYRKGRVLQRLGETAKALEEYEKVILAGSRFSYYFACNAALQCGLIYEKSGDKTKAYLYFKKCLALNPSEYKDGLHQKAKVGLSRLDK
jgi:tetratricopeptide (TPR) repeat protein